jgi:DNA-binding response OmpR family regulator
MSAQRILIVEDEPDLVRALSLNLKAEGFDVISASRGEKGI